MAPIAMFAACLGGMALGLAVDTAGVHPNALASLCTGSDAFVARMRLHWRFMPATHGLMVVAAVVAMAASELRDARRNAGRPAHGALKPALRRLAMRGGADALCVSAMVLGMAAATPAAPVLAAALGVPSFAALVAAMVLGMVGGMALLAPVSRSSHRYGSTASRTVASQRLPSPATFAGDAYAARVARALHALARTLRRLR